MLRNKLYFISLQTLRNSKKEKKVSPIQKQEIIRDSIRNLGKKYATSAAFEITLKTKIGIFLIATPFIIRHVFVYSWNKMLSFKNRNYLDLTLMSLSAVFATLVSF